MSDLKHQSVEELQDSRQTCLDYIEMQERKITTAKSIQAGQATRIEWIDKYLFEKTPQELTISEVERALGHKLIIKPE